MNLPERRRDLRLVIGAIREALCHHLGSIAAADAWLNSPETGYPTTAMEAIREGKAELVMDDLEQQWGTSPSHG